VVRKQSTQIGQRLSNAFAAFEVANLRLRGIFQGGALGGTRTPTILLTATSRQRVYQFRHER
jgi:hypothetical protein